jgi:hypothetical protein
MRRDMIICSCAVISDHDIEAALLAILNRSQPQLPTPGLVYRQLCKRMRCCGCAPLAVETIYAKVEDLERRGMVPTDHAAIVRGTSRGRARHGAGTPPANAGADRPHLSEPCQPV